MASALDMTSQSTGWLKCVWPSYQSNFLLSGKKQVSTQISAGRCKCQYFIMRSDSKMDMFGIRSNDTHKTGWGQVGAWKHGIKSLQNSCRASTKINFHGCSERQSQVNQFSFGLQEVFSVSACYQRQRKNTKLAAG